MKQLWAVVLAAGEGRRMHSRLPKVLHPLCGKPMLSYILNSAADLTDNILIVVGHGASKVQETFADGWRFVKQERQLGTGHAVLQALNELPSDGTVFVLCGDTPLIENVHLEKLLASHENRAATVATTTLPDPSGYGRIIRTSCDMVERIVEDRDAAKEEKNIDEINTGTYCFDIKLLKHYLPLVKTDNAQNEYYLTDVVGLMYNDGYETGAFLIDDYRVGLGINNRAQLAEAGKMLQQKINRALMLKGVSMPDPASVYVDQGTVIGQDTVIRPNCLLEKGTVVGSGCEIGPNAHLVGVVVGDGASVQHAVFKNSTIGRDQKIGPFVVISGENS